MSDKQIYKDFGSRIKELRKQRKWTQKELADKLEALPSQINTYESGLHFPPANKLAQLAEILDTSLDYLLLGKNLITDSSLPDRRLLERIKAMEQFAIEDQDAIIRLIDAMVIKYRITGVLSPFEQKAS